MGSLPPTHLPSVAVVLLPLLIIALPLRPPPDPPLLLQLQLPLLLDVFIQLWMTGAAAVVDMTCGLQRQPDELNAKSCRHVCLRRRTLSFRSACASTMADCKPNIMMNFPPPEAPHPPSCPAVLTNFSQSSIMGFTWMARGVCLSFLPFLADLSAGILTNCG